MRFQFLTILTFPRRLLLSRTARYKNLETFRAGNCISRDRTTLLPSRDFLASTSTELPRLSALQFND